MAVAEQGVRITLGTTAARRLQEDDDACTETWRLEVQELIRKEIVEVIPIMETLMVDVSNASTVRDSNDAVVALLFDVLIEIRSPVTQHDKDRYIEGPFDTQVEKETFAEYLRASGCSEFASVRSVDVVIPQATEQRQPMESKSGSSAGLISGLVLAIAGIVLLAGGFIYIRTRQRSQAESGHVPLVFSTGQESRSNGNGGGGAETDDLTNNDISTLGDPIPVSARRLNNDQSTVGSVSLEYDFQKAYQDAESTTDSLVLGSTEGTTPVFPPGSPLAGVPANSDNDTYSTLDQEEQFEVIAPAGLLGLILETNEKDGRPTVNNVKPTSVLAHVVKIGDYLLSVDEKDVTAMRANDVSKLIASKKREESRVLVFSRPRKGTFSIAEDVSEFE